MEELWTPIPGYPGYEASTAGQIRSNKYKETRIIQPHKASNGSLQVSLRVDGKTVTKMVHILVALSFIDNPDEFHHVTHLDGDPTNNDYRNLAWYDKPTRSLVPVYKYSEDWEFIQMFESMTQAAQSIGVSSSTISCCCRNPDIKAGGYHWSKFPPDERETKEAEIFERDFNRDILQYDKHDIYVQAWSSINEAAETLGISPTSIYDCCRGRRSRVSGYSFVFQREFN